MFLHVIRERIENQSRTDVWSIGAGIDCQFPETPPWTYPDPMVTLSYAKKNQMDPSIYLSLHNEVKDSFRDYDFIFSNGSVSDNKAAAAGIDSSSSIERLPDESSIFFTELHGQYLALDRV